MFENFFRNGFVPSIWKLSHVKPILKSGDPSRPRNYRPISLTCVLCKMMEAVIKDQILEYLHKNELISRQQHGFLAGRSACTQLLETLDPYEKKNFLIKISMRLFQNQDLNEVLDKNLIENQKPHQEPHQKSRTSSRTSSKIKILGKTSLRFSLRFSISFFFSLRISMRISMRSCPRS